MRAITALCCDAALYARRAQKAVVNVALRYLYFSCQMCECWHLRSAAWRVPDALFLIVLCRLNAHGLHQIERELPFGRREQNVCEVRDRTQRT